ncbi:hypothetical protein, variant [Capsaspora owczarzaki ATCC 30864]|uniref:Mediator of RNA polymerase II transcription subunit 6 n=1 Tax=Capsaspora owczarzaki (strain ATCC 30864) TaxID=595528 RepID=A0A0D2WLG4_CAPO3|nr:hypothetical protein, variant [Capsaspora owczarzaki ATCC 30864]
MLMVFRCFRNMVGLEYELIHKHEPELFVIQLQQRNSPTSVDRVANFYIINGVVYQAPDLYHVVNMRLGSYLHNLTHAFKEAAKFVNFAPAVGHTWNFATVKDPNGESTAPSVVSTPAPAPAPASTSSTETDKKPNAGYQQPRATRQQLINHRAQYNQVDELLRDLIAKYPPPTEAELEAASAGQDGSAPVEAAAAAAAPTTADTQSSPQTAAGATAAKSASTTASTPSTSTKLKLSSKDATVGSAGATRKPATAALSDADAKQVKRPATAAPAVDKKVKKPRIQT